MLSYECECLCSCLCICAYVDVYVDADVETVNEFSYIAWQQQNPVDGAVGDLKIMKVEETIFSTTLMHEIVYIEIC